MTLIKLNTPQILFIVIAPLIIFIGLFLAFYIPIHKRNLKKYYREFTYKTLYKISMNQDYYLINNFMFRFDTQILKIDHLLFADKFIYVISDVCFDGDIAGKQDDPSIILIPKNSQKRYEDNPIVNNKKVLSKLSMITGIDASLMVGVVVTNSDCRIAVESKSKQFYFIQRRNLKHLVKAIESRDVAKINSEQLSRAVLAIDKMNRRKRNNVRK